jgi:hypothetical protein
MLSHSNIDRRDAVVVSKAPFTYESTLRFSDIYLPSGSFLSIKIYVEETYVVPFRLHSIQQDGKVWFCDATGKQAVYWQTYEETETKNGAQFISSLLYNTNGVVAGIIACLPVVVASVRNIIESSLEPFYFPANAFILIPQCHVATLAGTCRAFSFESKNLPIINKVCDITLTVEPPVEDKAVVLLNSVNGCQISLSNTAATITKMAPLNGICYVIVNGEKYDCSKHSIVIKAAPLSDLRVIKDNETLWLRGVLNA